MGGGGSGPGSSGGGKGGGGDDDGSANDNNPGSRSYKKSNFQKGDYIDLSRFSIRFEKTRFKDPKTGQYIVRDFSSTPHGGSYWKLFKGATRIGTFTKEGKFLRT